MEKYLKLQASVFGNFKLLDLNQEPFRKMYQDFLTEGMMPSVMKEFDITTQTLNNRPNFVAQDNSVSLSIASDRIDVITDISAGDKMLGIDEFISVANKYLKLFFELFKIKGSRMSFITEGVSKVVNNGIHYEDSFLNMNKVYNKENVFEWSANSVSLAEWNINDKNEKINLNITTSLRKLGTIKNGKITNVDGIVVLQDINTKAEDISNRFTMDDIQTFLDAAKRENEKINKIIEE